MRLLIVTQYYPPEPFEQIADFVERLRSAGHEVTILTGFPCYPTGKTFAGFKQRFFHKEVEDGVLVHRVMQYPDHSRSAMRRILFYVSFFCTSIIRALLSRPKCDVVLAYQTSITVGLAGRIIGWLLFKRTVFYVVDLWPESVASTGMIRGRFPLYFLKLACGAIYRLADANICITEGYVSRLKALGVAPDKLSTVHYWAPLAPMGEFTPPGGAVAKGEAVCKIVYTGNIGPAQGLDVVIEAAILLRERSIKAEFIIVGDGLDLPGLRMRAEQYALRNVVFTGRRPASEMPRIQAQADALWVHLKPDDLSRVSIPSKVISYLRAAKPLLMCVEGECTRLVLDSDCGIVASPSNAESIVDAVARLVSASSDTRAQMGRNALALWEREFNPPVLASAMMEILARSCARRARC